MTTETRRYTFGFNKPDATTETRRHAFGHNDPERQNMGTPRWFFDAVQERCGNLITLDVCAQPHNAVVPDYYDETVNGLEQRWRREPNEINWCNPPFRKPGPWLSKACQEAKHGASTIMLLPFRDPAAKWVWTYAPFADKITIVVPRLRFAEGSPPFASSLWTFTPDSVAAAREVHLSFWHVRCS